MGFVVSKFPGESIVLVNIDLPLERFLPHWLDVDTQLQAIAAETDGPLTIVVDVRGRDLAFSDVLLMIEEQKANPTYWLYSPTIHLIIVGTHPLIPIGLKRISDQIKLHIQHFTSLSEALASIRSKST